PRVRSPVISPRTTPGGSRPILAGRTPTPAGSRASGRPRPGPTPRPADIRRPAPWAARGSPRRPAHRWATPVALAARHPDRWGTPAARRPAARAVPVDRRPAARVDPVDRRPTVRTHRPPTWAAPPADSRRWTAPTAPATAVPNLRRGAPPAATGA